ncbi:MAG: hypothetical protein AAGF77_00035 [Bacteroidota bacterium]
MKTILQLLLVLLLGGYSTLNAQIRMDQGVQAEGLWCFPSHTDSNAYSYLPHRARLALQNDSLPQFSYLRYVLEKPAENTTKSISTADGGGILTFLVLYDTPADMVTKAQQSLREKMDNEAIVLKGPILFDEAKYTMISSIITPGKGKTRHILASGAAPVMENSRIPLSFDLEPTQSKLLLESMSMATPDVSLLFELSFSGLSDSYEAELEVDWSRVSESHAFDAGVNLYMVGADVSLGFDQLRKEQAITLTSSGSDAAMESLVQHVYTKLLELMFRPVPPVEVPEEHRGGLADALGSLVSQGVSSKAMPFKANVGYQYKKHKTTGKSNMVFKGRSLVNRNHYITFNLGNLYQEYGNDERLFKDVPLWDPAFQQRDVYVGVDGTIAQEFDRMLNSVTVKLRKQHDNGDETLKEILITKKNYEEDSGNRIMTYLNHGDLDMTAWMSYDYKTEWKFIGGGTYEEDWQSSSSAMINLYTPFQRRRIELSGDIASLASQQVRAISVKIDYDFFGDARTASTLLYPNRENKNMHFEITQPKGVEAVDYSLSWFLEGGTVLKEEGIDRYGLLFVDTLPNTEAP